ncbi:MAG: hypothetical protein F8N36_14455 [Desulfovibrio sp.]|uniref:hypothetical protein n=1 Tax=Desulfovibrio sp. TaxID=885 RepID=UPI00135EF99F|nr:hypothetical protein [Desulfovibrio sp.]MTJ94040.1 hypothetical protein [Desulfovibrio sp.]
MTSPYRIQKLVHPSCDPSEFQSWVDAYGLTPRSCPTAKNDNHAIEIFRVETARCRSVLHRLVKFDSNGYDVGVIMLADNSAQLKFSASH